MCAIVGSFDREKLIELIELNSYRGSHSYSYAWLSPLNDITIIKRELGTIDYDTLILPYGYYGIVHVQAPTTMAKSIDSVHPAIDGWLTYLWHNGIIKAEHVKKMQAKFGNDTNWDTELLLRAVNTSIDELNEVDGSFSCLWFNGAAAYLFRNDISPMFYDKDLNISSTKFEGSISTPSNKLLLMDLETKGLYNRGEFKTVENPYFFGDD